MAQMMDRVRQEIEADNEYVWYQRRWVWVVALLVVIAVLLTFRTTSSGDSHNVFQDVHIEDCGLAQGQLTATGVTFNHGSGTKSYDMRVRFISRGLTVGEEDTTVRGLAEEHAKRWTVRTDATSSGALQCEIISVRRY